MNHMMKTANTIDRVLKVIEIFGKIAMIVMIIAGLMIGAMTIFHVDPAIIGELDYTISIGQLSFEIAESYMPQVNKVILMDLAVVVIVIPALFIALKAFKALRKIVQSMAQGNPFHSGVSKQIKKLALYEVLIGFIINVYEGLSPVMLFHGYQMKSLFLSEKILSVSFSGEFDFTFLLTGGIILLLSYVFAYGEQLQNLSDETL